MVSNVSTFASFFQERRSLQCLSVSRREWSQIGHVALSATLISEEGRSRSSTSIAVRKGWRRMVGMPCRKNDELDVPVQTTRRTLSRTAIPRRGRNEVRHVVARPEAATETEQSVRRAHQSSRSTRYRLGHSRRSVGKNVQDLDCLYQADRDSQCASIVRREWSQTGHVVAYPAQVQEERSDDGKTFGSVRGSRYCVGCSARVRKEGVYEWYVS
mmetsp:Transcript_25723/g.38000  ORF Transcript_25723/g.38000 Transcript_25723/m.38000 type:complete len:214 (-) Transcript_25723:84-725(-)